jgi:hypothetical protein
MTTLRYTPPKTIGETRNNSSPVALLGQPGPDLGVFLSLPLSFHTHTHTHSAKALQAVLLLTTAFPFPKHCFSSAQTMHHGEPRDLDGGATR